MNPKVLAYHSIGSQDSGEIGAGLYSVQTSEFKQQVKYLANGHALGAMSYELQSKAVVITFDDGLANNYTHAYPILKKFGMTAYFFVLAPKIEKLGYMTWQQVKELKDVGMIIGSHGMTHRILTELSEKDLEYELNESKKILEDKLRITVDSISIPRGFCNKYVICKAIEAGYKTIFTSKNRILVKASWDLKHFIRILNRGYSLKEKAVECIKDSSKQLLGAERYDKLRTNILRHT